MVRVWQYASGSVTLHSTVPTGEPTSGDTVPMACSSDDASIVITHRGNMKFTVYNCKEANSCSKKDSIDLVKEVRANGNAGFNCDKGDKVTDLRLVEDDKLLRVDYSKKDIHYIIDVQLADSVAKMRKIKRF